MRQHENNLLPAQGLPAEILTYFLSLTLFSEGICPIHFLFECPIIIAQCSVLGLPTQQQNEYQFIRKIITRRQSS